MLLPEVLSLQKDSGHQILLQVHVLTDLHYFPNHFKGFPILPGVVQLNWAMHYAHEFLPVKGHFQMMENIKFQSVVFPDTRMELRLEWYAERSHIEFSFFGEGKTYSSGRMVFGGDL